jgi:hypothetical protein
MVSIGPAGVFVRGPDGPIVNISGDRARARARTNSALDKALEIRALDITPEYVRQIRAAAPQFGPLEHDDLVSMKAVGVTGPYLRELAASGYPNLDVDDVVEARALGITGNYIRQMRAVGVNGDLDTLTELRAVGVTPDFVNRARRAGVDPGDTDRLTELRVLGPAPRPPHPPRTPDQDE